MRGIRRFAAPFVVAIASMSFAQLAGMHPAGATNTTCLSNCFVNGTTGSDSLGDGTSLLPWKTIQFGIDNVNAGGTVHVAAGTYVEDVIPTQAVTIDGAGAGSTTVKPASSVPVCGGGSLCGNVVILVRSSNVTISHLTVDGDSPTVSGVVVGGADINARDGIETDFNAGVFNNLVVSSVEVKNIYLRGIEYTDGSGFSATSNTVTNVQGDASESIGIYVDSGKGTISGNTVSATTAAVGTNHSLGTTMSGNVVSTSLAGVNSSNNGDGVGASADSITGNTVTCTVGGDGVYVFVPYLNQTVSGNTTTGCGTGLANYGSCNFSSFNFCPGAVVPTVTFTSNNATGATGASLLVTTDTLGFGDAQAKVSADHNVLTGSGDGVDVVETGTSTASVTVRRNDVSGHTTVGKFGINNTGGTTVPANCNWWGSASGPNPPGTGSNKSAGVSVGISLKTSNLNGNCTFPPTINAVVGPGDGSGDVSFTPGNPDGSPFTSFSATCQSSNGGTTGFASAPSSPIHVSGLTNGKSYICTVTATSANGTSDPSNASQPFVPNGNAGPHAPGAPTHVVASKLRSGAAKVTFNGPSSNGGAKVTKYSAVCTSSNGGVRRVGSRQHPPGRPIAVVGLTAGKKYTCIVRATNSAGVGPKSAPSNSVIV